MDEINIPEDFRETEAILVAGLTVRQAVLAVPAVVLAVIYRNLFGDVVFPILTVITFIFTYAFGWWKPFGMKFEAFVATSFVKMFLSPHVRLYKTDNAHALILEESKKVEVKMDKAEKKEVKDENRKSKRHKKSKNSKKKNRRRLDVQKEER